MESISGIVPPMVTPLKSNDELDLEGLENLIEHLISGGVHGLFILGTTGEGVSLSYSLRVQLIKKVCSQVKGRIPVLVGITDTSFKGSVYISKKSKEYGAEAVVLAPPYFYIIDQEELYNYTDQVINEISLPVYLYDNPSLTKIAYKIDTVKKLVSRPKVVGFKDSSADMVNYQKRIKLAQQSDTSILIGPEELLMESLVMGGNGGVPGGANIFPELYVEIYDAVQRGNIQKARKLHDEVLALSDVVFSGSGYGSSNVINGIKSALNFLNICNDFMAQPLGRANHRKKENIKEFVSKKELAE